MRLSCIFFFQAEDGIRDLVRSRGLGDVYKRQVLSVAAWYASPGYRNRKGGQGMTGAEMVNDAGVAVSYTHLTLPTSDLV